MQFRNININISYKVKCFIYQEVNFNYHYINHYIDKSLTNCFNSDRLVDWLFPNLLPVQFWFCATLKPFSSRAVVLALVSGDGIIQRQRERVALHSLHTNLPKAGPLPVGWTVWDGTVSVHRSHFLNQLCPLFVCPVPDDGEGTGCDVDRTCQLDGVALEDLGGVAGQSHRYVALWKGREKLTIKRQKWGKQINMTTISPPVTRSKSHFAVWKRKLLKWTLQFLKIVTRAGLDPKNVEKASFSISYEFKENAVWISGCLATTIPKKSPWTAGGTDNVALLRLPTGTSVRQPDVSRQSLPVPRVACWWSPCENSKKASERRAQGSLTFLLLQSCALALLITSLCIKHHGALVHPGVKATMRWGRG